MLHQCSALVFLLGTVLAVTDFDHLNGRYEFIYHHTQDLLLTIHDNACYHTKITSINCKEILENQLLLQIHYDDDIRGSSLQRLRDSFSDLLANFHCLEKDIYELHLSSSFSCTGNSGDGDDK